MTKKIGLFIADDHQILRQGLIALLEREKAYRVVGEASSGQDTIDQVSRLDVNVLILDVSMPDLSGPEIAGFLKKQKPHLKIVCLTMHDNEEILYRMYQAGADAYVLKDNAAEELTAVITDILHSPKKFIAPSFESNIIQKLSEQYEEEKNLTPRELEVLKYLAAGKTNKEISGILTLSVRTVEAHRKNIMEKIHAGTAAEMIKFAIQKGYV